MIRVGIAGIGFMGLIHFLAYRRVKGARVTALASRDARKLAGDWRGIKGNFGPAGGRMDLSGIRRYAGWEEMIDDPEIDLIDICLPPALHAPAAVAALKAGKHVVCEKPMALTSADAARMQRAAQAANRLLLVAHVLPFFPEYAFALKLIREGNCGRLLGGQFKRVISDPLWLADFYNPRIVGGPLIDLHIHDAHFIRLAAGLPTAVFSSGRRRDEVVEFVSTEFVYPQGGPTLSAVSGVIRQQGRPFTHAFELQLEGATLFFEFADLKNATTAMPLTLLSKDGKVVRPKLKAGDPVDAFVAELDEACRSIRRQQPSEILSAHLALDALRLCEKQSQSVRTGRLVRI